VYGKLLYACQEKISPTFLELRSLFLSHNLCWLVGVVDYPNHLIGLSSRTYPIRDAARVYQK